MRTPQRYRGVNLNHRREHRDGHVRPSLGARWRPSDGPAADFGPPSGARACFKPQRTVLVPAQSPLSLVAGRPQAAWSCSQLPMADAGWDAFGSDSEDEQPAKPNAKPSLPAATAADEEAASLFGSDTSSDSDGGGGEASPQAGVPLAVDPMLLAEVLRACPRRYAHEATDAQAVLGAAGAAPARGRLLPAALLLLGGAESRAARLALRDRLVAAGAEVLLREEPGGGDAGDGEGGAPCDCVCAFPSAADAEAAEATVRGLPALCAERLLPGGSLLVAMPPPSCNGLLGPPLFAAADWVMASEAAGRGIGARAVWAARVVSVGLNFGQRNDSIHHAEAPSRSAERARLEQVVVARGTAERTGGVLSEANFRKATGALQQVLLCFCCRC